MLAWQLYFQYFSCKNPENFTLYFLLVIYLCVFFLVVNRTSASISKIRNGWTNWKGIILKKMYVRAEQLSIYKNAEFWKLFHSLT